MPRVTLDLPDGVRQRLDELKKKSDSASLAEVVRRALSVYDAALTEEIDGGKVLLEGPDGKVRQVLIR